MTVTHFPIRYQTQNQNYTKKILRGPGRLLSGAPVHYHFPEDEPDVRLRDVRLSAHSGLLRRLSGEDGRVACLPIDLFWVWFFLESSLLFSVCSNPSLIISKRKLSGSTDW